MEVGKRRCRKERVSRYSDMEKQTKMDGASPSEEFRHSPPRPTSFPPNSSPSPSTSTPPFLFKTSLTVKTSSGTLLLQDYRKTHRQEQALGGLVVVLRQSLQIQAKTPNFHQPQPPNLHPPPSRPPIPKTSVLQAPAELLALSWYYQDQTSHRSKETPLIQHRPASVAISDPHSHDHPLSRPVALSQPPPKAVSNQPFNSVDKASFHQLFSPSSSCLSQYLIFLTSSVLSCPTRTWTERVAIATRHLPTAEVVSRQFAPLTLPLLQDEGVSSQSLNPDCVLQRSRLRRPDSRRQSFPLLSNTSLEFKDMSSFTSLFKRPRTKSEKRLDSPAASPRSEGAVQTPLTPRTPTTPRREPSSPFQTALPWTRVDVPELPAEWGPFYEAGQGNPYSPLRNNPRPQIPQGSPPFNEDEIGTKFPTLSNGPGIQRRVFVDPGYECPEPVTTPELDRVSFRPSSHESDRPSYRSLTPESDGAFYHSPTPEQTTSLEQLTPSRAIHRRENANARSPGFIFPDPTTGLGMLDAEDSTVGSILQKYGEERMAANQGSPSNEQVEIDSRLSNWAWSPPNSIYTPSVNNAERTLQNPNVVTNFAPPTAPPSGPLPDLPLHNVPDFLDPGPSQVSLPSTSSADSTLERLLAEHRVSSASHVHSPEVGSLSARSFAQVSLLATNGSMHSRQLSARETSIFESEVIDRLRGSGILGTSENRYIPQGRLSIEYLESGENEVGDPGPGSLQSSSSVSAVRPGIVRSGTPPLLFGSRAIGTGLSHYEQENDLADNDQDWETDAGSNARSRRKLEDVEATAGTGSSIADVSDSSNVSALRTVATGQVLVHPAHPRYQHSWTLLQDAQVGNLVLTPEYTGTGVFPDRNNQYQHPTRLSPGHDNPFSISPPLIRPSPRAAYNLGETAPPLPPRNPRRLRSRNATGDAPERKVTHMDDGDWVSTVDETTSYNGEDLEPVRQGSFAKVAIVGRSGNVTGTPEGTGAREVGSSLADASSPVNEVESPASKEEVVRNRRTVDGSLNSAEANAPGNFYERMQNHRIFQKDSDDSDFERNSKSMSPEDLSPEIRQHRQHLVEHALLPRHPTPPFTEPQRISVPDHLLTSSTPANMAKKQLKSKAGLQAFVARNIKADGASASMPQDDGTQLLMRSREQRSEEQDISANIPTPFPTTNEAISDGIPTPFPTTNRAQSAPPSNPEPEPATTPPRPETARPYTGPYDDFIQATRGPTEQRGRPQLPIAGDRPVARVESPHLYRLPRPAKPAIQQRQKELGRVVFAMMLAFAPSLLVYGYGGMDRVMAWLCYGDIVAFPETEKKVAVVVGWIGTFGLLSCIIYAICQAF